MGTRGILRDLKMNSSENNSTYLRSKFVTMMPHNDFVSECAIFLTALVICIIANIIGLISIAVLMRAESNRPDAYQPTSANENVERPKESKRKNLSKLIQNYKNKTKAKAKRMKERLGRRRNRDRNRYRGRREDRDRDRREDRSGDRRDDRSRDRREDRSGIEAKKEVDKNIIAISIVMKV